MISPNFLLPVPITVQCLFLASHLYTVVAENSALQSIPAVGLRRVLAEHDSASIAYYYLYSMPEANGHKLALAAINVDTAISDAMSGQLNRHHALSQSLPDNDRQLPPPDYKQIAHLFYE